MAASLVTDVANGLRVTRKGADYTVTLALHAQDLTPVGGSVTLLDMFEEAEGLLGSSYDSVTYQGQVLPRQDIDFDPWPPTDAGITLTFAKDKAAGGGYPTSGDKGPALLSGGTFTELAETDFDATNLALAVSSRASIKVYYTPTSTTLDGSETGQDARVPVYNARSQFSYTRVSMVDPSADSRTYVGKTNSDTFQGMTANTVLCTSYVFDQQLDGSYRETISFAYDPYNEWRQFARYVLEDGKFPELTTAMIAAANGMTIVTVQGQVAFSGLAIVLYTP